ncbi:MAG TPA: flagellar hook-associated protein FlgL [Gammaproteobacteria bacterium]|nr:flagellar hook-associated protein FlgL [Gammaproteobacteria bacterium]
MRITDSMTNDMLSAYLLRNRSDLYKIQEETSSGKKVSRPSDDPGAYDRIINMRYKGTMLDQYQTNSTRLKGDLLTMDSQLQGAQDQLLRASEIVISGSDGTKNPEDLKALAQELNQILESLVNVANSKIDGSSVYSGLRQDVDAYLVNRDAEGYITTVTYQGSDQTRKVEIAEGEYLPATLVGSDPGSANGIFQTSEADVFAHLIHIRDRLLAAENLGATESFTADPVTDTLTVSGLYATGSSVTLESSESLPGGLSPETTYYAIRVSDTEIQLAATLADARAGIAIDLTDAGSGDMGITQTPLADIERDETQMMEILTRLGAYEERLAMNIKVLDSKEANLADKLESEESVDIAEAAMQLTAKQAAYEASMQVTTATMQLSLLNYL